MKRPAIVTVVNLVQILLGLLLASMSVYMITVGWHDSGDTFHGMLIGGVVIGIPALITLVAVPGLWRGRFWGWVFSLATDVGILSVFVYSIVKNSDYATDMIVLAVGSVVPAALL